MCYRSSLMLQKNFTRKVLFLAIFFLTLITQLRYICATYTLDVKKKKKIPRSKNHHSIISQVGSCLKTLIPISGASFIFYKNYRMFSTGALSLKNRFG